MFKGFFSLPPSRRPFYARQAPPKGGRYEPNMLRCSRLLAKLGSPMSGGWNGHRCRCPSARSTISGPASTSISATNMAIRPVRPPALRHFSANWRPRTSRRSKDTRPLRPLGCYSADVRSRVQASRCKTPRAQAPRHPLQAYKYKCQSSLLTQRQHLLRLRRRLWGLLEQVGNRGPTAPL